VSQTDLYSDAYFIKARDTLRADGRNPVVTMQVFQRKDAILCGLSEAANYILDNRLSHQVEVDIGAHQDGNEIRPWETIMHITGPYQDFAALETQYLGILARGTMVATNARAVVEAANGKPVFFMGSRHTHWKTQAEDGYAAVIGGCTYVGTDASGMLSGDTGMGTMPHSFIAAYGGSMFDACQAFARHNEGPITALVDFNNNSINDISEADRALGDRLTAVRLDTSGSLVDEGLKYWNGWYPEETHKGVNPDLILMVRHHLDTRNRQDVQIVVSGGFGPEKIADFEALELPVDMYGVGSSILVGSNDYTADIVEVDGKPVSKVGRSFAPVGEIQNG
jgi:nicotinate phosphoribosyltransferase